jgi:hypothetical protein
MQLDLDSGWVQPQEATGNKPVWENVKQGGDQEQRHHMEGSVLVT